MRTQTFNACTWRRLAPSLLAPSSVEGAKGAVSEILE